MADARNEVLSQTAEALGGNGGELSSIAEQLRELVAINEAQQVTPATTVKAQSDDPVGSAVEGFFESGLGLSPLISGLVSLFGGGGDSSEPAPLTPFVMPLSVNATAGISAANPGGAFAVDSAEGGAPRAVQSPQVTVQVQAMDSQSFLDRSQDIALAVRQAMLQSSVLNDVIREV